MTGLGAAVVNDISDSSADSANDEFRQFSVVAESVPIFVQIASQIISAIRQGELVIGAKLPTEAELCSQFGVSRASVREALSSLQFAGYVESRRGSGTVVCSRSARGTEELWGNGLVKPGNIVDILEARLAIEPATVRQAALKPATAPLGQLKKLLGGMELSIDHPELNARTDLGIHLLFAKSCTNPFLSNMTEQLVTHSEGLLWRTIRDRAWQEGKLPRSWLGHHGQIARAIATRDAEAAETGMTVHLLSVLSNVASSSTLSSKDRKRVEDLKDRYSIDGEVERGTS